MDTSVNTQIGVLPSTCEVGDKSDVGTDPKIAMTEKHSSLAAILRMVNSLPIPKIE